MTDVKLSVTFDFRGWASTKAACWACTCTRPALVQPPNKKAERRQKTSAGVGFAFFMFSFVHPFRLGSEKRKEATLS